MNSLKTGWHFIPATATSKCHPTITTGGRWHLGGTCFSAKCHPTKPCYVNKLSSLGGRWHLLSIAHIMSNWLFTHFEPKKTKKLLTSKRSATCHPTRLKGDLSEY